MKLQVFHVNSTCVVRYDLQCTCTGHNSSTYLLVLLFLIQFLFGRMTLTKSYHDKNKLEKYHNQNIKHLRYHITLS